MAITCTVYDVFKAFAKYDGSETAHADVIDTLKKHGHKVKMSDAWCTETVMAAFYDAGGGAIDLIGGFAQDSVSLRKHAQNKGIWYSGKEGILPGDIVLYGKNGKTNHTEYSIGKDLNISGNYNKGCSRRTRSGRTIIGYIRPKYKAMPKMNNLQVCVEACNCILGIYGTGSARIKNLSIFGSENAKLIQAEVDRVWDNISKTVFDLSVYTIAGFSGKGTYRVKRLGSWSESVQKKINDFNDYRGKSDDYAANHVLSGIFGTGEIRKLLLTFCGYNAGIVQARVNELLKPPDNIPSGTKNLASIVSLFRDYPRATKEDDGLQGDCVVVKSGAFALVMDVMKKGAIDKIWKELEGYKHIAVYFSHPHSDHMGENANALIKSGKISKCYLPAANTIASEYKSRYQKLVNDCNKQGVEVVILTRGSTFDFGDIHGDVLFQQFNSSKDSVNMRSLCTLITVAGETMLTCGDHHCGASESDFKAPGHVTIYKGSHHALFTGDKDKFVKAISPDWIFFNWKEWPRGGLGQDAKVKAAVSAYQKYGNVLSGDLNGRIEFKIENGIVTAIGEKGMIGKTVTYTLDGKTYRKTVHVCEKAQFHAVSSMAPKGGSINGIKDC